MVDITHKRTTLRKAVATAEVKVSRPETIEALEKNLVPKGNVFEMAKTAGLFAVKNTHTVIPDCHPLPVEFTSVDYEIEGLTVKILFTVKTVYKTGVEVEAMHGASVVALTMYDMLKPLDKGVEIHTIKLIHKQGGKSSYQNHFSKPIRASVVVCSDTISAGKKQDRAGKIVVEKLRESDIEVVNYDTIPDAIDQIREKAMKYSSDHQLLIYTGGTGLSETDVTPEALEPILERRIPGVEEAIRNYGQQRMPYSMLSRSVVGTLGGCLVIALPGSTNGAKESMDAIFPHIKHIFKVLKGPSNNA